MHGILHQAPEKYGFAQARWTLPTLLLCCGWLRLHTEAGLSQVLDRLGLHWKRAQAHLHSPDPAYSAKLRYIDQCLQLARDDPEHYAFLFLDEVTIYRQPSLAFAYEVAGATQPMAHLSCRSNTAHRVLGAVDARLAQVLFVQRSHITVPVLTDFFQTIGDHYPQRTIFIGLDNWPVHFHRDLLAALQPQTLPWPPPRPPNWPTKPRRKIKRLDLPIQLLSLPTYAPWTNPMEKVWRGVKQTVVHLHRCADDLPALDQKVADYLNQFADRSPALLNAIGLGKPGNFWTGRLRTMPLPP